MKELRRKGRTPPGGWRYEDPDTGFKFRARYRSLEELAAHVTRYRDHNELPSIPNLTLVIESWLCSQPGMVPHCKEAKVVSRKLMQYLAGAKAAAKMIADGERAYVNQQTAEARAEICAGCRLNRKNEKHSRLERYTDKFVQSMVGDRKTSLDSKLLTCEACTCPLRPKVHVSQSIVEDSLTLKEKKILNIPLLDLDGKEFYCWQTHPVKVD